MVIVESGKHKKHPKCSEADIFARALLMPEESFVEQLELNRVNDYSFNIEPLVDVFGVEIHHIQKRFQELEL